MIEPFTFGRCYSNDEFELTASVDRVTNQSRFTVNGLEIPHHMCDSLFDFAKGVIKVEALRRWVKLYRDIGWYEHFMREHRLPKPGGEHNPFYGLKRAARAVKNIYYKEQ